MLNKENNTDHSYISPATLEDYLEKDLLVEYLRALETESLEYAIEYIGADEPTDTRILIAKLIHKEITERIINRMSNLYNTFNKVIPMMPTFQGKYIRVTKDTLTIFLANHKLTDYLQTLSDEELEVAERNIVTDDLVGDALDILSAIRIEKEYRNQNKEEIITIKK